MAVQMAENADARLDFAPAAPIRLTPLLAGLLAAGAALILALMRGHVLPLDIAAVFLVIGLATTWIARRWPLRGALFVAVLAAVVLAVVYGG
jgi:hypothetical protein